MKAISLWQPWATLIAIGAKKIETRSWETAHRGQIAIHAAKRWDRGLDLMCESEPFASALNFMDAHRERYALPLGAIVAVAHLDVCVLSSGGASRGFLIDGTIVKDPEFSFGDYSPGRFAWKLSNVRKLPVPLPWAGSQRIFNVPDQIIIEALNGVEHAH
jgi:hypothetical protein